MKTWHKWLIGISIFFLIVVSSIPLLIGNLFFQLEEWDDIENIQELPATPNILMLIAEDMSARVGAFGDDVAQTPNIDRLAEQGIRYPNTFTTAGVCSPSRAAFISGMHQISMGGQHMRTATRPEGSYLAVPPINMKAFPELLRKAGYYTFNTIKLDYQFSGAGAGSGPFTIWDGEDNGDLWRARENGQPFFGIMNFMETHETGLFSPLGTKPHSLMHFGIQLMRAFGGFEEGELVNTADVEVPPYYPDTEVVRSDIAKHYQNINGMDKLVGKIIARLEKDGLLESTIIIWTTDHGDCLPRGKRELYDTGIKVPMVIRWPDAYRPAGLEPGAIDERLISFIDFAPTFLQLANAPIPEFLHGRSFYNQDSTRKYIHSSRDRIDEVYDRQRAVRDERFKYIRSWYPEQPGGHHIAFRDNLEIMRELWTMREQGELNEDQNQWFENPGKERLFDTQDDPFELHDLSQDTSYTEVLDRMRDEMDRWLSGVEDWSDIHENDMVDKFQSGGIQQTTPNPQISTTGQNITITAAEGASIGYRIDDGRWQLYTKPFSLNEGSEVSAKAIRYGWKESEEVK